MLDTSRKYYMYVVLGNVTVNGLDLSEGDGLSFENEKNLYITNPDNSEIILFDLKP